MKKTFVLFLYINLTFFNVYSAVHTVTNTNDSGAGSLRQAIIDTNADADPTRTINFSIGSGVQTIQPLSDLPFVTVNNVTIDGTTQPGWSIDNPQIVIDGTLWPSPGVVKGLITLSATNNCIIQGLVFNNASKTRQNGILMTDNGVIGASNNAVYGCFIGTDQTGMVAAPNVNGIRINAFTPDFSVGNIIGGSLPGQRNIISGNNNGGIEFIKNVNNTIVQGNYIGTDKTGRNALPNKGFGIASFGSLSPLITEHNVGSVIGGSASGERNIISGNTSGDLVNPSFGVVLLANSVDTIIKGNYIGVDVTGENPLPNDIAVGCLGNSPASSNGNGSITGTIIGGPNSGEGNIISASNLYGIILNVNTLNSIIQGNFIGTDASGTLNFGNGSSGILIQGGTNAPCNNNLIGGTSLGEGNIIAYNGSATPGDDFGVYLLDSNTIIFNLPVTRNNNESFLTRASGTIDILNPILGNSIFNNINNGIELQDNENNAQQPPTLTSASLFIPANRVTINVTAPSAPIGTTFRLEFFINDVNRNPITEGKRFIGAIPSLPSGVTTTVSFDVPLPLIIQDSWVSATATNLNNTGITPGDTSEFTLNIPLEVLTQFTIVSPINAAILEKYYGISIF